MVMVLSMVMVMVLTKVMVMVLTMVNVMVLTMVMVMVLIMGMVRVRLGVDVIVIVRGMMLYTNTNLSGFTRLQSRGRRLDKRWACPIVSYMFNIYHCSICFMQQPTCLNMTVYHCARRQGRPTEPASHTARAGAVCREGGSLDWPK